MYSWIDRTGPCPFDWEYVATVAQYEPGARFTEIVQTVPEELVVQFDDDGVRLASVPLAT
jgi:hypothetical protein